jgi:hypothetical protein
MNAALKRVLVPHLRSNGFTGTLPHFRRRLQDRIDLLSVQFFSGGGSFVVEIASCEPTGLHVGHQHVVPAKITAQHIGHPRPRLGSPTFPHHGDHWFRFAPGHMPAPDYDREMPESHYTAVAQHVVELVGTQAEWFWSQPDTVVGAAPARSDD